MLLRLVVFLGAFLLFCVELMVGKVAMPRFGGSPAVWTTGLFFFQLALLGGYAWAQRLAAAPAQVQRRSRAARIVKRSARSEPPLPPPPWVTMTTRRRRSRSGLYSTHTLRRRRRGLYSGIAFVVVYRCGAPAIA